MTGSIRKSAPFPDHSSKRQAKKTRLHKELPKKSPSFRITGQHKQEHGKPLYSLAWGTDLCYGKSKAEYQYLAMCGHNVLSIYAVQVDTPRGIFQLRQTYRDLDKNEQFYAIEFAGKSKLLGNAVLRTSSGTAASYAANAKDISSSESVNDKPDEVFSGFRGERNSKDGPTLLLEKEHCVELNYMTFPEESSQLGRQLLCAAGVSGIIKVIDTLQMKQVSSLRGHGNAVYDLKVSPTDENLLLSASVDESIRLWNLGSFSCVAIFAGHHGHEGSIVSLSWHTQGQKFASSGTDQSIRLWSLDDGKVQDALAASKRLNPSRTRSSFHPTCSLLPYFVTKKVHRNVVDCICFLGHMILSKSTYNSIVLWVPLIPKGMPPSCNADTVPFNPPSDVMAIRTFDLRDCNLWFVRFALNPGRKLLAVGTIQGEVDIWDMEICKERPSQKLKAITNQTVRTLAFSPNGKILVTCCDNGHVCKWYSDRTCKQG